MLCDNLEGWEVEGRSKGERTYTYLWLNHVDVWQKPTQHCKAIILQLNKKFLKRQLCWFAVFNGHVIHQADKFLKRHTRVQCWRKRKKSLKAEMESLTSCLVKTLICKALRTEPRFSSVQFSLSVVSNSLWLHRLQHTRLPCPSPTSGAYSNSCPLSRWCHPTISSSLSFALLFLHFFGVG